MKSPPAGFGKATVGSDWLATSGAVAEAELLFL